MMSISCLADDAVLSGSWFIQFKVLMLNIAMSTIFLHLSKLSLSSVAEKRKKNK